MSILRFPAIAAASFLVAIVAVPQPSAAQPMVGNEEISAWIAARHPNVRAGDRRINAVLIVVDTSGGYVASVTDSLPTAVRAAIDSGFAAVAAHNAIEDAARELVAGRLRVPGTGEAQPVYIVDGVRTKRVDSLTAHEIEKIQLVAAAEAASAYGPDAAAGGAIVVTITHGEGQRRVIGASNRQRLTSLGLEPDRVDLGSLQIMHVRSGVHGPSPLYITVMHLK
jgi:hypothetical protein